MKMIVYLLKLITELDKDEDQSFFFKVTVYRLVRCQPRTQNGTNAPPSGSDAKHYLNSTEKSFGNHPAWPSWSCCWIAAPMSTPSMISTTRPCTYVQELFRILETKEHHDLIKKIAVLLMKNGAHLDMVSLSGDSAVKGLTPSLMEMNIQVILSLRCLAASAVLKYGIPYVGHIPDSIESFVQMHG